MSANEVSYIKVTINKLYEKVRLRRNFLEWILGEDPHITHGAKAKFRVVCLTPTGYEQISEDFVKEGKVSEPWYSFNIPLIRPNSKEGKILVLADASPGVEFDFSWQVIKSAAESNLKD